MQAVAAHGCSEGAGVDDAGFLLQQEQQEESLIVLNDNVNGDGDGNDDEPHQQQQLWVDAWATGSSAPAAQAQGASPLPADSDCADAWRVPDGDGDYAQATEIAADVDDPWSTEFNQDELTVAAPVDLTPISAFTEPSQVVPVTSLSEELDDHVDGAGMAEECTQTADPAPDAAARFRASVAREETLMSTQELPESVSEDGMPLAPITDAAGEEREESSSAGQLPLFRVCVCLDLSDEPMPFDWGGDARDEVVLQWHNPFVRLSMDKSEPGEGRWWNPFLRIRAADELGVPAEETPRLTLEEVKQLFSETAAVAERLAAEWRQAGMGHPFVTEHVRPMSPPVVAVVERFSTPLNVQGGRVEVVSPTRRLRTESAADSVDAHSAGDTLSVTSDEDGEPTSPGVISFNSAGASSGLSTPLRLESMGELPAFLGSPRRTESTGSANGRSSRNLAVEGELSLLTDVSIDLDRVHPVSTLSTDELYVQRQRAEVR
jgi:hypothetical protein